MSYLQPEGATRNLDRVELGTYNVHIPVYNVGAIFLDQDQRERFEMAIEELLRADEQAGQRRARHRVGDDGDLKGEATATFGGKTGRLTGHGAVEKCSNSNAVIIMSGEGSLKTADSVPLAIALWRVRMWEGEGFANTGIVSRWLSV
jgi:hypothetical protein